MTTDTLEAAREITLVRGDRRGAGWGSARQRLSGLR